MQWLNYHHLYYFYVIASEGSVTDATVKLKLAQSTLSAQLKQFEDVIGYRLFERKHRKLFLTDVGRRVYEYAHEIFALGNELRDSLGKLEDSLGLSVRVGVMDSVPKKLSRNLFAEVLKGHGAKIMFTEESLPVLCERLDKHDIDLILANDKPPTEVKRSGFHAKLIGNLKVIFVTSPKHVDLIKDFPRSLNNQSMIMPGHGNPIHREAVEYFKINNIQPRFVGEVDDIELQKLLVIDGYGFTALPSLAVDEELRSGRLIRLSETPICHENLWLISGHRLVQNPIAKMLLDTFRPTDGSDY